MLTEFFRDWVFEVGPNLLLTPTCFQLVYCFEPKEDNFGMDDFGG